MRAFVVTIIVTPPLPPEKRLHFWSKCREEIVEVHHLHHHHNGGDDGNDEDRVNPSIEESSKTSMTSTNKSAIGSCS